MSTYDQNLLDEAPKATRAQLQEGYNVDLLEEPQPPRRTPSVRNPPPPQAPQTLPDTVPLGPVGPEASSGEKHSSVALIPAASKSSTSFWRTRNGVITILVVVLVVVGAVVGGAVGGTVKKSNNKANMTGTNRGGTSAAGPQTTTSAFPISTETDQGFGGVSTSHGAPVSAPTATGKGSNSGGQVVGH